MKRSLAKLALLLVLAVAAAAPAHAGDPPADAARVAKALERAKALEASVEDTVARISKAFVVIGGGSGIIISADGDVITNHHVAGGRNVGQLWPIQVPGRGIMQAKVLGHDPRGDITLLKIEGKAPHAFVEVADSDGVEVGDAVIALGNPFGHAKDATPTVTLGAVSCVHRYQGGYSDAIQTDAPINPGNSGGPLLDARGRLVGINGRIAVRFGTKVNTGVGYAIPANQVKRFLEPFRKLGTVSHGLIQGLVFGNSRSGGDGAVVERVVSGSPAASAGLKAGDVIVEADGRAVAHSARLHGIIGTIPAGETIELKIRRGDATSAITVPLASRDADAVQAPKAYLGVKMGAVKDGEGAKGVPVDEVEPSSPAEAGGIKPGDRIREISGKPVFTVAEVITQIAEKRVGQRVVIKVLRDGKPVELQVTLAKPKKPEDDD